MSTWQEKAQQEVAEAIDNLTHADTILNGDWLESVAEAAVEALVPLVEAEVRERVEARRRMTDAAGHAYHTTTWWDRDAIEAGDPR